MTTAQSYTTTKCLFLPLQINKTANQTNGKFSLPFVFLFFSAVKRFFTKKVLTNEGFGYNIKVS